MSTAIGRTYEQVSVGEALEPLELPLPMYRLVMAAGATRDFTAIHHNDEYARASGAPSAYANALLLLGMWERVVRDYIGPAGQIRSIRNFRMVRFNPVGSVVRVDGVVVTKELVAGEGMVDIELRSTISGELTVGPGRVQVVLGQP